MRLRDLSILLAGCGLAAVTFVSLDSLFGRLHWYLEVPYDARRWTWFLCAQAAGLVIGVGAVGWALLPRLRRLRFAALILIAAAGAAGLRWPSAYTATGLGSIQRFSFWRNGSELFEASPEYLAWAEEFAARLETLPGKTRELCETYERLGDYYLRVGRVHNAVGCLERAHLLVATHRQEIESLREGAARARELRLLRWLGIAYLRAGEVEYCLRAPNAESCIFPLAGGGIWRNPGHALRAQEYLTRYLELDPDNPGVRWLLNVAHMSSGTFPDGVPERYRLPPEAWDGTLPTPRFTNVAVGRGIDRFDVAGGAVMDDFDGDGRLDVVASCLRLDTPSVFYHNLGDGSFVERTSGSGLEQVSGSLSFSHADYDNDGDLDLFFCRGAWLGDHGLTPNVLMRNRGDGTFEDASAESGIAATAWPCLASAWCDYDLDGDLDLYVGNERLRPGHFAPSELWNNQGNGRFVEVAAAAGVANDRSVRGASWGDFDEDGDYDLYVSNFGDLNRLYRNRGDGTFEDVAESLGVAEQTPDPDKQRTFQSWFFDFDNDGWLDIFSASYPLGGIGGSVDGPAASLFGEPAQEETCKLWINDRSGGFRDVTAEAGLMKTYSVMGANFGDLDGDGWTDIYLGTGAPAYEVFVPNALLLNEGGSRVRDVTAASGIGHMKKGHGAALGDVDGDGDLDLYQQLGGWFSDDRAFNALFRNDGPAVGGRWITLRLRGTRSNRSGFGARVTAWILENGVERPIRTICGPGASFGGNSLQIEMGLGAAERIDRVEVVWPRAGTLIERTEVYRALPMQRVLILTEEGSWQEASGQTRETPN